MISKSLIPNCFVIPSEGVSKVWNIGGACPPGNIWIALGHRCVVTQGIGKATAVPLEEATQEPMAVAKVASSRGISAS